MHIALKSPIIVKGITMTHKRIEPDHIGIIIKEELLEAYDVSAYRACKDTGFPEMTLNHVLHRKRTLSLEGALKLCKYFGVDPKYLLNIQTEIEVRKKEHALRSVLERIQPLKTA